MDIVNMPSCTGNIKSLLFCLAIFSFVPVDARKDKATDELNARLSQESSDTGRLAICRELAIKNRNEDSELSFTYAKAGLSLSKKIKSSKHIGGFHIVIANNFIAVNNYIEAKKYADSALAVFKSINDRKGIANVYTVKGGIAQRESDLVNAIRNFLESYKIAASIPDLRQMYLSTYNIAIIYCDQGDGPKAVAYALKAQKLEEQLQVQTKDDKYKGNILGTLAEAYRLNKDTLNARKYFADAARQFESKGDEYGLAATLTNWALIVKDLKTEMEYQVKAQEYFNASGTADLMVVANLGNLGDNYYKLYNHDVTNGRYGDKKTLLRKAEKSILKSIEISRSLGNNSYQAEPLKTLAMIQYLNSNYKGAYEHLALAEKLTDSIFSQENKNSIAALESQQRIDLRDKMISLGKLELKAERRQTLAMVLVCGLLVLIGFILYGQSRSRRRTNARLLKLNEELDDANKMKARFFGVLSHDLRSPVAHLVSYLRIQQDVPDIMTPEQDGMFKEKIKDAAENLLETMESVLVWSKGQMQHFKPNPEDVPVEGLYEDMRKFFSAIYPGIFIFEDPEHLILHTDREFIRSIMRNLTDNAVKSVRAVGEPSIVWSASRENDYIKLAITDNGPGASPEQLKVLFDDKANIITSNGLGFHLIRDMAKAIDCRIVVNSQIGKGTTFQLNFMVSTQGHIHTQSDREHPVT